MNLKLVIIGAVVIVGAVAFLPQTMDLIPNPPSIIDSVKNDLSDIQDDAIEKVEGTIEGSIDSVKVIPEAIIPVGYEEIFYGKLLEGPTQAKIERHGTGSSASTSGVPVAVPTVITTPQTQTISYETLSLVTEKQADNTIMLKYEDTSGQTISVTVTMRNDDKILFTGQFFSSSFEATVLDAANTSHFIDMIVDHEVHGTISASAFNPVGSTDSQITGVFTSG